MISINSLNHRNKLSKHLIWTSITAKIYTDRKTILWCTHCWTWLPELVHLHKHTQTPTLGTAPCLSPEGARFKPPSNEKHYTLSAKSTHFRFHSLLHFRLHPVREQRHKKEHWEACGGTISRGQPTTTTTMANSNQCTASDERWMWTTPQG